MIFILIQICIILFFPFLAKRIAETTVSWLSPVVLCYLVGIILANVSIFPIDIKIADYFTQGTILLAIPFLLYSTDLSGWLLDFKSATIGFLLCVLCGIIGTTITAYFLANTVSQPAIVSGMIAAIFSGGIPNMQAVGMALEVDNNMIVLLNASDIFIGGIYLILLTSIIPKILSLFLQKFQVGNLQMSKNTNKKGNQFNWKDFLKGLGVAILIIGSSVGLSLLIFNKLEGTFIILLLTTLSIVVSRIPQIRALSSSFETGDYLLLMFCVAVGMMANFDSVLAQGWSIILFMAMAWVITVLLHWLLCYFFKIDRDSTLIAGTAAIYGPVFIGQIASTIDNRRLVFPGIALGLLGIAMGNYIGVFVAYFIQFLIP